MYYVAKFYEVGTPYIFIETDNLNAAHTIANGYNMLNDGHTYGVLQKVTSFPDGAPTIEE